MTTGRHKSMEKSLQPAFKWLQTVPGVNRVIVGVSTLCRHSYKPGTLRYIRSEAGGIRLRGYNGRGVTEFFVITKRHADVFTAIQKKFPGLGES